MPTHQLTGNFMYYYKYYTMQMCFLCNYKVFLNLYSKYCYLLIYNTKN